MVRVSRSRVSVLALASVATSVAAVVTAATVCAQDKPLMMAPPTNQTVAEAASAPQSDAATPVTPPAPSAANIVVPQLDGIVGTPSKDLLPPISTANQAPVVPPAAAVEPAKPETAVVNAAPVPSSPAVEAAKVAEPVPAFALAVELAERIKREKSVAREDRDAALKFYDGRKGEPVWVTEAGGLTRAARALLVELDKAADYGLPADAFKVPAWVSAAAPRADLADTEASLTLAALKYARYARGGRMDPAALSAAIDRKAQLLSPAKVLEQLATSNAPDATLRKFNPQNPQFEKLRLKYVALRAGNSIVDTQPVALPPETGKSKKIAGTPVNRSLAPAALERKLLANMEMWRWMPDMGNTYIQPNIPEFTVSVVRDGKLVHKERIVTGKTVTMTPMFSDSMRLVVFKPFWNVPESIKFKELQPGLLRSGGSLEKAGLRAEINGRPIDPRAVDWAEIDMRQVHIFQPPGEANALGKVKFLFPNKHDVYLHDTPSKSLFNEQVRAFSHGCMRVRDPLKLAEVILSNDKGWTRAQVDKQATSGPDNTEIKLTTPIPVHITYFTTWVDDEGKLHTVNDIYGHEQRIQLGIEGKTHLIAQPREEKFVPPSAEERRRFAEQRRQRQQAQSDPVGNWVKSVFNF